MARVSRCDKLPEQERLRLVGAIGEGRSWRELAGEFGISEATIREWAERNGYQRSPTAAKRKLVDEILTRAETAHETAHEIAHCAVSTGNPEIDIAAHRDATAAIQAGNVALAIIARLEVLLKTGDVDAKEVATISTALDKAWGTYARIYKLDDAKPTTNVGSMVFKFGDKTVTPDDLGW